MINLAIAEVLDEAEELINGGNSYKKAYGQGLLTAATQIQNDIPSCLIWGISDFEGSEERMRDFFKVYNFHIMVEINELIGIHKKDYYEIL